MTIFVFLHIIQYPKRMRKTSLLFIGIVLIMSVTKGQDVSMGFIPNLAPDYPQFSVRRVMQQHDGDIVTNIFPSFPNPNGPQYPPTYVGNALYKVSPTSLIVTDSLFFDDTINYFYYAKDPRGEGNLRISGEPNDAGGAVLRISRFADDDLCINPLDDIVVPLYEDVGYDFTYRYMIDSRGDIIVEYYTLGQNGDLVGHMARFSLDGALLHEAVIPQNRYFMDFMGEYQSTPLRYYVWSINSEQNLVMYLLDENFEQINSYVFNKNYYYSGMCVWEEFRFDATNTYVIPDGEDVLIAAAYYHDSCFLDKEEGEAVVRYNLRTMQQTAMVKFNEFQNQYETQQCLCFEKASDGNLYFMFRESGKAMTIVKMDSDFNIAWTRHTQSKPYLTHKIHSSLLYDEHGQENGIYIVGYNGDVNTPQLCYFFLTDESLINGVETNNGFRPYAFYPNPAQDQLSLQYSPDVEPSQIELYDLQGRLVRSQGSGLESLNLQGLAPGQYVMKVTLTDGTAYSDKVVKE